MYDLLVWEKISFIQSCDMEEIKATDCIIKVHITSGNIKWRSFALRFCASNHKSAWQPFASLYEGPIFYFYLLPCIRVMVIFTLPFCILSFGKHIMLEGSWYIWLIGCEFSWTITVDITLEVKHWEWYISVVSTFPNTFALVLDSNLHDLNGTNPDWRCFQQNYHGVIFVQK